MPKSFNVKVEPSILIWARTSIGYSQEDIAKKVKKNVSVIAAWEKGIPNVQPTFSQLEKLAQLYKRPLAVFFLPSPPQEKPLKQDFRTLPDSDLNAITSEIRLAIRRAKRLQSILYELNDNRNPIDNPLHKTFKVDLNGDIQQQALELRKHLNISIDTQTSWKNEREALNEYKDCFERNGIFVFQQSLPLDKNKKFSARGFSLNDPEFPLIVLNSKDAVNSRIFTLFHELCHILFNTGGIFRDMDVDSFIGDAKKVEMFCNAFAGLFLVPTEYLKKEAIVFNVKSPQKWSDNELVKLSKKYKVSEEVILRRLLDLNLTTQNFYKQKRQEWEERYKKIKRGKGFISPAGRCLSERGKVFISLVLDNYRTGELSMRDTMDYLGVGVTQIPKVENMIYRYAARAV